MRLLSTLSLDDAPVNSSTDTVQYSADGQLAVVTRSAIYILTPDFDSKHGSKSPSDGVSTEDTFGWSKTAIQETEKARVWSENNEEWRAVALGTLEPVWQSISWSPSGLNKLGGCLLAALTNNAEVSIWAPTKNSLIGEWVKLQNITEEHVVTFTEDEMSVEDVLRCQTCAIAWSGSCSEESLDSPVTANSSLLALGNRFGDINFFYWDSSTNKARHCMTCHIASAWVTSFAWSRWKQTSLSRSTQAHLACGLSDGSVWILRIDHNPDLEEPYSVFKFPITIEPDSRLIAAMTFADTGVDHQLLLAVAKPGFVCLYSQSGLSDNRIPEGVSWQTVVLSAARISMASSRVAACTGLHYVPFSDSFVVVLAEGSLNVVAGASRTAYLEDSNDNPGRISTSSISKVMRRLTESSEACTFSPTEYARIHGLQFIGTRGYVAWAQVLSQPYDLSFRIQAHFKTRVCIAKLWDQEADNNSGIISSMNTVLKETKSIACFSPVALLREVMFETLNSGAIVSAAPRLLPLLSPDWEPNNSSGARVVDSTGISASFIRRTRLKFSLALFILNRPTLSSELESFFRTARDKLLELSVALHVHETVGKVLGENGDTTLDIPALLRFVHAAQYCRVPESVASRFSQMRLKAQEYAQQHMPRQQLLDPANDPHPGLELLRGIDAGERCPACDSIVPFQNLARGQCQAGHVWRKTFIIHNYPLLTLELI
ncbi:hypothetical protein FS749_015432 [Ceratobasidium sp. UAMH 11750]|nr:hypothetical protein FS749_015432 [Ceratobasidium sp. UAMH 11750]